MLTILNIINYFVGKPLPFYLLILITVAIYFYFMYNYWDNITSNKLYWITNLILLLIDITAIMIIFSINLNNNENDNNNQPTIKENKKKKKTDKNKKNNKNSEQEIKTIQNGIVAEENLQKEKELNENMEKSILSLYEPEKDISLSTYK
jgi:hypothetical protein